ncbi:40254_t:CDS:2, partial [Gigaspora margarita]
STITKMLQSNSDSNTSKYINLQNSIKIEEISTYPLDNIINYKERKNNQTIRSFTYIIENEDIYLSDNILVITAQKMGTLLQSSFNNKARLTYHIEDKVNLKSVDFSVDKCNYHIDFSSIQENQKIQSLAIKTTYVDLNNRRILNYSEIDLDTVKILDIGIQRSAKDILIYLILQLEKKGILYSSNPTIHLHVSGDGRNTGSKIKHVMCEYAKEQHSDLNQDWHISKDMKKIAKDYKNFHGHTNLLIFDMITIENVIFDILHAFLHITDQLWSLILAEVKERGLFNDSVWKIIKDEMHRLNISFNFWKVRGTCLWNSTSLCGNDKMKVL